MSDDGRLLAFGAVALVAMGGVLRRTAGSSDLLEPATRTVRSDKWRPADPEGFRLFFVRAMNDLFFTRMHSKEEIRWRNRKHAAAEVRRLHGKWIAEIGPQYRIDEATARAIVPPLREYLDWAKRLAIPKRRSFRTIPKTHFLWRMGSAARRAYDQIGAYESVIVAMDGYFKDNIPEKRPWSDEDEAIESTKDYYESLLDALTEFYKVDRVRLERDMPGLDVYLDEIRQKFRPRRVSFRNPRGSRATWRVPVASYGFEGDGTFTVSAATEQQAKTQAKRYAFEDSEIDEWEVYRGDSWEIVEVGTPQRRHSFREP